MSSKIDSMTGVILAGGESSRMESNKALLRIGNETFIERMLHLLQNVFENILISTNDINAFRFLGVTMIEDIYKGLGPLSGIHACLAASSTENNFYISCDLPLMSLEMIRYIAEYKFSGLAVLPAVKGRTEYFPGIYTKRMSDTAENILAGAVPYQKINNKSNTGIRYLISECGAEIIDVSALPFYNADLFCNMNSEEDYEFIRNKIKDENKA